jgi:hypothetical protein
MNKEWMDRCKRDLEIIEQALRDPEAARKADEYLLTPSEYVFVDRSKVVLPVANSVRGAKAPLTGRT